MDRGRKHQRNKLVPVTEGQLRPKKTRRSQSSYDHQVNHPNMSSSHDNIRSSALFSINQGQDSNKKNNNVILLDKV